MVCINSVDIIVETTMGSNPSMAVTQPLNRRPSHLLSLPRPVTHDNPFCLAALSSGQASLLCAIEGPNAFGEPLPAFGAISSSSFLATIFSL